MKREDAGNHVAGGPAYRHRWQEGDLVIFHNPGLPHRSYRYSDTARRVMHRTTLKGIEVIAAHAIHGAAA